jgi:hypothetical protein
MITHVAAVYLLARAQAQAARSAADATAVDGISDS